MYKFIFIILLVAISSNVEASMAKAIQARRASLEAANANAIAVQTEAANLITAGADAATIEATREKLRIANEEAIAAAARLSHDPISADTKLATSVALTAAEHHVTNALATAQQVSQQVSMAAPEPPAAPAPAVIPAIAEAQPTPIPEAPVAVVPMAAPEPPASAEAQPTPIPEAPISEAPVAVAEDPVPAPAAPEAAPAPIAVTEDPALEPAPQITVAEPPAPEVVVDTTNPSNNLSNLGADIAAGDPITEAPAPEAAASGDVSAAPDDAAPMPETLVAAPKTPAAAEAQPAPQITVTESPAPEAAASSAVSAAPDAAAPMPEEPAIVSVIPHADHTAGSSHQRRVSSADTLSSDMSHTALIKATLHKRRASFQSASSSTQHDAFKHQAPPPVRGRLSVPPEFAARIFRSLSRPSAPHVTDASAGAGSGSGVSVAAPIPAAVTKLATAIGGDGADARPNLFAAIRARSNAADADAGATARPNLLASIMARGHAADADSDAGTAGLPAVANAQPMPIPEAPAIHNPHGLTDAEQRLVRVGARTIDQILMRRAMTGGTPQGNAPQGNVGVTDDSGRPNISAMLAGARGLRHFEEATIDPEERARRERLSIVQRAGGIGGGVGIDAIAALAQQRAERVVDIEANLAAAREDRRNAPPAASAPTGLSLDGLSAQLDKMMPLQKAPPTPSDDSWGGG